MEVFNGVFIVRKVIPTRSSGGGGSSSSSRRGGAGGGAAAGGVGGSEGALETHQRMYRQYRVDSVESL